MVGSPWMNLGNSSCKKACRSIGRVGTSLLSISSRPFASKNHDYHRENSQHISGTRSADHVISSRLVKSTAGSSLLSPFRTFLVDTASFFRGCATLDLGGRPTLAFGGFSTLASVVGQLWISEVALLWISGAWQCAIKGI